jgi:hypothetical protein
MSKFRKWRWAAVLLAGLAVVIGVYGWSCLSQPAPADPWEKIQPRLRQFDQSADAAANKRLQSVRLFFKQREPGANKFAVEVLSWSGKFELLKDTVGVGDHRQYLVDTFDQNVFSAKELQDVVINAQKGYLSDLDGLENDLLVQLRADLADSALGRGTLPPYLATDEAFRLEYQRLTDSLLPKLMGELKFTAGREIVGFVVMDLGTQLTTDIGVAALVDLGVDASFLTSGLRGNATTLCVGLVVGYLVDQVLDWVLEELGHNPEADITRHVLASVGQIRDRLLDGDAAALADHARLVRVVDGKDAQKTIEQLEKSGRLGLRQQFRKLQEIRARLREEALRKLAVGDAR